MSSADGDHMTRITVRVPDGMREQLEQRVERGEFASESEAVRAGIRRVLMDGLRGGRR